MEVDGEEARPRRRLPGRDEGLPARVPRLARRVDPPGVEPASAVSGCSNSSPAYDLCGTERQQTYVRVSLPSAPILGAVASSAPPAGEPGTRLNFVLLNLCEGIHEH